VYASGTDAIAENMHQFLTHMLSISVKIPIFLKVPSTHVEHMGKELMHALRMCVRN
jgi:hypothetical protein